MENREKENQLGKFIEQKRKQMGLSFREIGAELGFSCAYMSDVEKGKRRSFSYEKMQELAKVLKLTEEEKRTLYTLAGFSRNTIPLDLIPFITDNPSMIDLLRELKIRKR